MGACIGKAPPLALPHAVRGAVGAVGGGASGGSSGSGGFPKQFDVFVSHQVGVGDELGAGTDFSEQFAGWIAELCIELGLKVSFDKTNLLRIMDERDVRDSILSSRMVVGVVTRESLSTQSGQQQEFWWASSANVPIVAMYDGDHYGERECAAWKQKYPFVFARPAVAYKREGHVYSKDELIAAIHEVLLIAYKGLLPDSVAERLDEQADRRQRRARKAERRAARDGGAGGAGRRAGGGAPPATTSAAAAAVGAASAVALESRSPPPRPGGETASARAAAAGGRRALPPPAPPPEPPRQRSPPPGDEDTGQVRIRFGATDSGGDASGDEASSARGRDDKRFRFRDEDLEGGDDDAATAAAGAGAGGISRLLRSLRDPLGRKEQEQRIFALTEGGGAEAGEVRFEPTHHNAKPCRGILKGSRAAAGALSTALVPRPEAIEAAKMDPKVVKGLERLSEFLESITKESVAQLPTVLRVLQLMIPNLELATKALAVVFDFVQDVAKCRQVVVQHGGIKDIVAAMGVHVESVSLQTYGVGCLYALSCFRPDNPEKDNNSAAIAHSGGIARIAGAMEAFPMCREVQQWGAGALRHLAVEIGSNRREISEGGEVQLTMRGINKRMISKVGGIELLVKAMLKFPDDAEVQENSCAALCNLINSQESKVRAARAGCIRAATKTLATLPEDPELAQLACALLRGLALGVPENKIAVVAQGGVRRLCQAMARHRGDPDVNVQAVAALCNLTSQVPENKRAICEAGGLELSVAALRALPGHTELHQQGCGLLHNLACDRGLRAQVLAAGGLQVAEVAMQKGTKSVQSLGKILARQLQENPGAGGAAAPAAAQAAAQSSGGGAGSGSESGGVDGLFAPRRPGAGAAGGGDSGGAARAKAGLSRPQRKVMADVLDSMRKDPKEWLPSEDGSSEAGSFSVRRRRRSSAAGSSGPASPRSEASSGDGRLDASRRRQAAAYGIEDLEGISEFSDAGPAAGAFDFIVRRGLAKQKGGSRASEASSGSGSEVEDFVVRRRGRGRGRREGAGAEDEVDSEAGASSEAPSEALSATSAAAAARGAASAAAAVEEEEETAASAAAAAAAAAAAVRRAPQPKGSGRLTAEAIQAHEERAAVAAAIAALPSPPGRGALGLADRGGAGGTGGASGIGGDAPPRATDDGGGGGAAAGGWIDLFEDDDARETIARRALKEHAKTNRGERPGFGEGAAVLRELLGEVEIEEFAPPPPPRIRRSKSKVKFVRALRKCGDAPPERFDADWKEVLHLKYEQSQQSVAVRGAQALKANSAEAASALLNGLDGIGKVARQGLGEHRIAASDAIRKKKEGMGGMASRVREQGLVPMVQGSGLMRRLRYGLDDDEDSIFGLDELEELGQAEVALLDALGATEGGADESRTAAAPMGAGSQAFAAASNPAGMLPRSSASGGAVGGAPSAGGGGGLTMHKEIGAARLEALSSQLASKRDARRRVKLL